MKKSFFQPETFAFFLLNNCTTVQQKDAISTKCWTFFNGSNIQARVIFIQCFTCLISYKSFGHYSLVFLPIKITSKRWLKRLGFILICIDFWQFTSFSNSSDFFFSISRYKPTSLYHNTQCELVILTWVESFSKALFPLLSSKPRDWRRIERRRGNNRGHP